jgi:phage repressor protein C with HTH and peptisase S24 domain
MSSIYHPERVMSLAERIKERREALGITQTELAELIGIKQQSVGSIENGETKNPRKIFEIAQALKCSVQWLKTGEQESNATQLDGVSLWEDEGEDEEDDVYLPFFKEAQLAAGEGRVVELDCEGKKLKFSLRSLKNLGVKPEEAACMSVWGNSMEPVLPDGATVAIDTGSTDIRDGEIYAIDHEGMARVKLVYRLPGGGIRLRSFNSDEYPDEFYYGDETNKIRIVGFVFWYGVTRRRFR